MTPSFVCMNQAMHYACQEMVVRPTTTVSLFGDACRPARSFRAARVFHAACRKQRPNAYDAPLNGGSRVTSAVPDWGGRHRATEISALDRRAIR